MNAILEQINSTGKIFVEFALQMLVQSSVLILILLLTDFALRKKVRALFRYGIWLLVLLKLVLPTSLSVPLSLGYFFGDQLAYVDIAQTTTETAETAPAIVSPMIDPPRIEAGSDTSAIATTTPTIEPAVAKPTNPPIVPVASLSWQGAVFLAWLTVVLTVGLLLLQRAIFVRGLIAQAKESNSMMNDTLVHCRERMGVKRKIGLKVSANATSPAVCGLFRPVILVPQNLTSSLNPSQLRAVLLHELAHIRRGDLWVNLAQTILQIIYFYNPLLWVANCIIRRVREQAVDEMVLVTMGEKARQYPQTLVSVAKLAFKRPALSLRLIGVVESKSALAGRIKHILNRPMPKRAKLGILGLAVVIITAAILLPMASCTPGPPSLVIKGVVKDAQTGKPIAGARVFDDGYGPKPNWEQIRADERSEWGAITNSAGEYSFLTWPEHHSIKVEAPGYKAKRQSLYDGHFVFNKKDEEIFDFALEPEKVLDSSGFKRTLPNGVTVELVGICEHPSEGKQWWRPDGAILELDHAPFDYSRMTVKPDETEQARELALRFAGQDVEQMSFRWKMDMATRSSSHPFYVTEKREKLKPLRNIVFKLPQNLETLDFSIGVATGEWKRVASGGDGRTVSGTNDSLTDSSVIFHEAVKEKDTVRLCATHLLGGDYDCRIVVVDRDDEIHESIRSSNTGSDMCLCKGFFDLSPDQIEYILLQARPYDWVEFKNVSLRPGHKTDVQIEGGKADDKAQIENAIRQLWTAIEANDIEKVAKLGPQGTFAYDNFDITNWVLKQAEEKKRILTERSRDLAEPDDIWIRGDEAIALKKMTRWYQDAHVYFFVRLPDGWTLYTMDTRLSMPTVNQDYLFRAWPRTSLDNKAWGEYSQAADLLHKGVNRAELARRFSSIGQRYAVTRQGRICAELGILLARMVEKDKSFTEPADLQFLPTDEQINYYIFKLRDVAEREAFVPGKCRVLLYPKTPNSPAVALRNMGRAVIPAMISLLDDRRPTRSVGVSENGGVVLRYCDVALEIIEAISGQKFDKRTERGAFLSTADETTRSGIISRAKAWWHQQPNVQVETGKPQSLIFHGLDLTAVPHTTNFSKLPDLFEERPLGSKSYHIQKDVTAIYSGLDGTVYFIPRRNIFYVQHDKLGSSTLTYYGPFEGNPVQVLNLQPDVQVEGKKKKPPVWLALLPRSPIRSAKELYLYFWGNPLVSDQTKIDSFELEIRSAKDNVRMARINGKRMVTVNTSKGEVLQWSMFRDGLRENMIRRIGPLEDGEYLIAIHVNGIRCSNVAKFTVDSSFDSSNEPTLQVVPLVPAPGKKLQYFGLRATGPTPQDSELTNMALHFPDIIVDGVPRKILARDWSGPVYPLKPGQQHEEILLLKYYKPEINLSRKHTVKAIVGKYESAPVEIGFDHSLGLAWGEATTTIKSRPPQPPVLEGRVIGPDGKPGIGYRVRLYAGPRRKQCIEYSDKDGKYDFPNVPTGKYKLTCQPRGNSEPALTFEQFQIEANKTVVQELSLEGKYAFSGKVTYEDGSPAADVKIVGRWEIGGGNVFRDLRVTDENGYYELTAPFELARYISLSIFTPDGTPAQGSYEHIGVMGSRTDVDFVVKRREIHAAIWPEKFARMGGKHPDFQPVSVPEGWDYLRLLQALYKHLETQCKAKLPDCRATLKDEVIKLSFNTREYNIIRPGNAKRTGMRRNNDRGIGPEPDGLILTVHFSKTAGQFDRPYIIDRSPWTGFISQVYLPDIKLYLNVDIQYGTGINEKLLTDLCAPTSWLKTIFNNFNERTLEQEAWGNAVEKDSQPDVQVDDGSNAPISEASKENKKPPEPNEPTYGGRSLTEIIDALGDQDFQTRIKAVYHLGYMGPKAKPAVPALVDALDEERLRESVLRSLGNIGVGAEEAIPALIKAIAEYAPACRWMAAESLAKIGKAAVPALKEAARSEDIYLQIWCNAALAKQQGSDSPNLRYLAQLMKNADKRTAGEAVSALTMLGPISKPLVPDLIEALKHSVVPKRHIASALARIGKDAGQAVPELTKMLQDTDLWTRADVISALSRIGGPDVATAVPLLIQALKTNDTSNTVMASRVRYTAATALGSVGPDARSALPALVIALGDKDEFVRANLAKAIGDIDPTDMQAVPALIEAMKDESGRVRVAAAQTLLKIGPVNKEVILAFIEAVNDNWKGVITACETFFSFLGPQHSYVIPNLIGMLKTPNERAQRLAIRALGNMGESAVPAVPYIIEGMKNSRLEAFASGALKKLGPRAKAAVPELIKMLGDKRKRFSAASVLEAIGPEAREAIPALQDCLGDRSRVTFARALLAINPKSEKAIQQLVRVSESAYVPDQWTEQPDAHYLLVKYGYNEKKHLQSLIDALENPNSRIRLSAAAYLGNLGAKANDAAESLGRALKDDDPEVRAMAARAILLISLKPSERKEACNTIAALLGGKDFTSHGNFYMAQVRAAGALTSFGPLEEWTVPLLIANVQDGSMRTRVAAIKAFGNIGPGAKEAIPYLKRLLKDKDWRIRHFAAQAIEKIDNKTDVQVED